MMLLANGKRPLRSIVIKSIGAAVLLQAVALPARGAVSLEQAIEIAHQNDPWLVGSEYRQRAVEAQSIAAGTLPDPMVNIGVVNLPTDNFEFDEEAMTQFKVGVSQTFPRGNSRALDQKRLALLGTQYPHQREDRRARVAANVAQLWLEVFRATETIRLIEGDRALFEQLVDVAQSSYSSAMGRTRQQDLIRAQLELTRLDDRLTVLHERLETSGSKLGEWLRPGMPSAAAQWQSAASGWLQLPQALPHLSLRHPELYSAARQPTPSEIATYLNKHPAMLNMDAKIDASGTGIELAEQKYKPQWGLNASYGYREDAPDGRNRPDFVSAVVTFDLPFFTANRQDKQVQSAIAGNEADRTDRALLLRSMLAGFETQRARLQRLEQRRELYQTRLLGEIHDQAEASLTAYTNDDGDFAEVVRARIAELNTRIDALNIDIDRLKTISQLNYFFATSGTGETGEST